LLLLRLGVTTSTSTIRQETAAHSRIAKHVPKQSDGIEIDLTRICVLHYTLQTGASPLPRFELLSRSHVVKTAAQASGVHNQPHHRGPNETQCLKNKSLLSQTMNYELLQLSHALHSYLFIAKVLERAGAQANALVVEIQHVVADSILEVLGDFLDQRMYKF